MTRGSIHENMLLPVLETTRMQRHSLSTFNSTCMSQDAEMQTLKTLKPLQQKKLSKPSILKYRAWLLAVGILDRRHKFSMQSVKDLFPSITF